MFFKATLLLVLAVLGVSNAQVIRLGSCPSNVQVVPNFNVSQYLGTWYEFARYPTFFEAFGKCNTAVYTQQANGTIGVTNSMINEITGEQTQVVGTAKSIVNGKLLVQFPQGMQSSTSSNYWVLDTDYTTYSVVYTCQPLSRFAHFTFAWILTRERQPSNVVEQTAQNVFAQNQLSYKNFMKTSQTNCNN